MEYSKWAFLLGVVHSGLLSFAADSPCVPRGPANKRYLEQIRDEQNETLMRRHAWSTLQRIIANKTSGKACWDTWPQKSDILDCSKKSFLSSSAVINLEVPSQLVNSVTRPDLLQSVHFHPNTRDKICTLNEQAKLDAMLDRGWRFIDPFDRETVVVKAVWWPHISESKSILPLWDGVPVDPALQASKYPFSIWPRLIAVSSEPTRPTTDKGPPPWWWEGFGKAPPQEVSLDVLAHNDLYVHQLSKEEAESDGVKQLFHNVLRPQQDPKKDDYLLLIGLHVATKELDDWVWMTFWWHDRPNDGPFAADRPIDLDRPWSNYLMDVTFSETTPRNALGKPKAIFNPWLEADMDSGVRSNCMTCHRRAVWCKPEGDRVLDPIPPDDEYFRCTLRLDYLWSIQRYVAKGKVCPVHNPPQGCPSCTQP